MLPWKSVTFPDGSSAPLSPPSPLVILETLQKQESPNLQILYRHHLFHATTQHYLRHGNEVVGGKRGRFGKVTPYPLLATFDPSVIKMANRGSDVSRLAGLGPAQVGGL